MDADVPATVAHGDAHGGNFGASPDGTVDVIDAETFWRSIDAGGDASVPQATDVGRFSQWLISKGADRGLSSSETHALQQAFVHVYRAVSQTAKGSRDGFNAATRFYRLNLALIVLRGEVTSLGLDFDLKISTAFRQLVDLLEIQP